MLPDRVSNPGPLTYESDALPIALRGPVRWGLSPRLDLILCRNGLILRRNGFQLIMNEGFLEVGGGGGGGGGGRGYGR